MKILIDLPDELYDTLQSKTLNLTSDARSNGKHLVYELIGCITNGTVITDNNIPFVTGLSADNADVPECETWSSCDTCEHEDEKDGSNCYECVKGIENKYTPKEVIYVKCTDYYENDPCKACGNNPKNGGSGVCQCILGQPKIT